MARKAKTCLVEVCPDTVFARGYCRRHYNQWYSYGHITDPNPAGSQPPLTAGRRHSESKDAVAYRLRSLYQDIKIAQRTYDSTVGLAMRIERGKTLRQLRSEAARLEQEFPESANIAKKMNDELKRVKFIERSARPAGFYKAKRKHG